MTQLNWQDQPRPQIGCQGMGVGSQSLWEGRGPTARFCSKPVCGPACQGSAAKVLLKSWHCSLSWPSSSNLIKKKSAYIFYTLSQEKRNIIRIQNTLLHWGRRPVSFPPAYQSQSRHKSNCTDFPPDHLVSWWTFPLWVKSINNPNMRNASNPDHEEASSNGVLLTARVARSQLTLKESPVLFHNSKDSS